MRHKILVMIIALLSVFLGNVVASNDTPVWIDVRTEQEFKQGHIQGAILVPHNVIGSKISKLFPNKYQRINLYCRSGRRSEIALRTLEAMGYTSVQNIGGYKEAQKAYQQ